MDGRKDTKVRQDESYLSTGDLAALNTSSHTGFAPGTHRVPASHVSTGAGSVSRPCSYIEAEWTDRCSIEQERALWILAQFLDSMLRL